MFLEEYGIKSNLDKNYYTYDNAYNYWKNTLLEYAMKIFSYEGLPDSIPMHEIMINLFLYGKCGIQKNKKGEWICSHINLFGNTDYIDKFTSYTWNSPINSGECTIGKNGFLIRNNSLMNALFPKIHRYACKIAHTEVTLVCRLINMRDDEVFTAMSEGAANTVNTYQKKKANGQRYTIIDPAFSTLQKLDLGNSANYGTEIRELYELRSNLFASFLEEIGLKKSGEKKQRLIESEVTSDNAFLKLNIKDMIDTQQADFDILNAATGMNIKVIANVDYEEDSLPESDLGMQVGGNENE